MGHSPIAGIKSPSTKYKLPYRNPHKYRLRKSVALRKTKREIKLICSKFKIQSQFSVFTSTILFDIAGNHFFHRPDRIRSKERG